MLLAANMTAGESVASSTANTRSTPFKIGKYKLQLSLFSQTLMQP